MVLLTLNIFYTCFSLPKLTSFLVSYSVTGYIERVPFIFTISIYIFVFVIYECILVEMPLTASAGRRPLARSHLLSPLQMSWAYGLRRYRCRSLSSGPGQFFGHTLVLLGICFGSGVVIFVSLLIILITE